MLPDSSIIACFRSSSSLDERGNAIKFTAVFQVPSGSLPFWGRAREGYVTINRFKQFI